MSQLWSWVEELEGAGKIALSPEEARHVSVRRLRAGDSIVVFDGRGRTAEGAIEAITKRSVEVVVGAVCESPRPASDFVLGSAIPKVDRLSTMLQMLTQLGLETWQPLLLEDSAVRRLDSDSSRLTRILVESAKVARRPWLLDLRPACSLERALADRPSDARVYFGDRAGEGGGLDAAGDRWVLIGPEAGFSEAERAMLRAAKAEPRSFAPHNLRIETAAVAAMVAANLAASTGTNGASSGGEETR